jgi:orotidine-5'-phosphate decarboxylase
VTSFADRLDEAVARAGTPALVGLDPHLAHLPAPYARAADGSLPRAERARLVGDFCLEVLELVAGRVAAVKPQSAFFEQLGADGVAAWERVVTAARERGLLVIGDLKRGDVSSSAAAYAAAYLEDHPGGARACDAITVNPYLGSDSVAPFLELCRREGRGLYVLVRTSNPGGAELQAVGVPPLSERVAALVVRWGAELVGRSGLSSVGAVVGATHPGELARLRAAMPRTPLLLPGYGAQGAGARDVVGGFLPGGRGALVNSSRGLLFAWRASALGEARWREALLEALERMRGELREALER